MDQLLNFLLTQILIYGYPIILGSILLAYIGVPIPLNALVLAAGAFVVDGTLQLYILFPLVCFTVIVGDIIQYGIGRKLGYFFVNMHGSKIGLTHKRLESTNKLFHSWGAMCIFLTRWLLTPLGIPVNLIAGVNKYPVQRFIFWTTIGEVIWVSLYITIGYLFGSSWTSILEYIDDAPRLITLLIVGAVSLVLGIRLWKTTQKA